MEQLVKSLKGYAPIGKNFDGKTMFMRLECGSTSGRKLKQIIRLVGHFVPVKHNSFGDLERRVKYQRAADHAEMDFLGGGHFSMVFGLDDTHVVKVFCAFHQDEVAYRYLRLAHTTPELSPYLPTVHALGKVVMHVDTNRFVTVAFAVLNRSCAVYDAPRGQCYTGSLHDAICYDITKNVIPLLPNAWEDLHDGNVMWDDVEQRWVATDPVSPQRSDILDQIAYLDMREVMRDTMYAAVLPFDLNTLKGAAHAHTKNLRQRATMWESSKHVVQPRKHLLKGQHR